MKLEKGFYYVGDPGYLFNQSWEQILNDTEYFKKSNVCEIFGKKN